MRIVVKMPYHNGDKVEIDGVVLSDRNSCERLCSAIMAAADVVWPAETETKEAEHGTGNDKK